MPKPKKPTRAKAVRFYVVCDRDKPVFCGDCVFDEIGEALDSLKEWRDQGYDDTRLALVEIREVSPKRKPNGARHVL